MILVIFSKRVLELDEIFGKNLEVTDKVTELRARTRTITSKTSFFQSFCAYVNTCQ